MCIENMGYSMVLKKNETATMFFLKKTSPVLQETATMFFLKKTSPVLQETSTVR